MRILMLVFLWLHLVEIKQQECGGNDMDEALKNMPEVELRLNDNSVYNKKGVIESISGVIDRQTGTVVARVVFPNESRSVEKQ